MSEPVTEATDDPLQHLVEAVVAHEREHGLEVDPALVQRYLDIALSVDEEDMVLRLTARRGGEADEVVMFLEKWGLPRDVVMALLLDAASALREGTFEDGS